MDILDKLFEMQDIRYKEFHSKLCPNNNNIIGVKVPILKKFAKELYKNDNNVLLKIGNDYYEEVMLQGLVIALSTETVDKKIELIRNFVKKIDNWAVCDIFCSSLKIKKSDKKVYFEFLKEYYDSNNEFELRFLLIMLLDHFLEDEYIYDILNIINHIKSDKYYVKMAKAWLLSTFFIKYKDIFLREFDNLNIDKWTYNKTIQKIIESKRVNNDDKNFLRNKKQ